MYLPTFDGIKDCRLDEFSTTRIVGLGNDYTMGGAFETFDGLGTIFVRLVLVLLDSRGGEVVDVDTICVIRNSTTVAPFCKRCAMVVDKDYVLAMVTRTRGGPLGQAIYNPIVVVISCTRVVLYTRQD